MGEEKTGGYRKMPPPFPNTFGTYRVTHKGWDFREDCTEFYIPATVSSNLWFPATFLNQKIRYKNTLFKVDDLI